MPNFYKRLLTAVLTTGLLVTGGAAVVRADGFQTPWFQGVDDGAPTVERFDPLGLIDNYRSFWLYGEGIAWASYDQWRLAEQAPAIYAARSAAPLPSLPSGPGAAPAPAPAEKPRQTAVAQAPAAASAPAPAHAQPAAQPDRAARADAEKPAPVPGSLIPDQPLPTEAEPAPAPTVQPQQPAAEAPQPTPAPAPAAEAPAPAAQPAASAAGLTADEQTMVSLVNAERAKAGLPALTVDVRLVQTARNKSADMIEHNYFSHQSPVFGSPFDQMRSAGIRYLAAGENIAGNQTVEAAHEALMNSPGHRANILSTKFTKIGIGIVKGGPYGLMVTQQFIGE